MGPVSSKQKGQHPVQRWRSSISTCFGVTLIHHVQFSPSWGESIFSGLQRWPVFCSLGAGCLGIVFSIFLTPLSVDVQSARCTGVLERWRVCQFGLSLTRHAFSKQDQGLD